MSSLLIFQRIETDYLSIIFCNERKQQYQVRVEIIDIRLDFYQIFSSLGFRTRDFCIHWPLRYRQACRSQECWGVGGQILTDLHFLISNKVGRIIPTTLLLAPPDFQTFLLPYSTTSQLARALLATACCWLIFPMGSHEITRQVVVCSTLPKT